MSTTSMLRVLGAVVFAGVLILALACGLKPEEYAAIDAWLLCDECIAGERARVDSIGRDAVPTLVRALRAPSPGRQAVMRQKFADSYSPPASGGLTRDQYADQLLSNYVATYQKRAALSLRDIGGDKARDALRTALTDSAARGYRSDVVQVIRIALAGLESAPFAGTVTPTTVAFADTVTVTQGSGLAWNGDEEIALAGPFPDSDLVVARTPTSLKFVAVGDVGAYALGVTKLGPSAVTQIRTLTIRSLLDANDRGMVSCGTVACNVNAATPVSAFPYREFLSLWSTPPRPDTADFFRLEPPSPGLTVTATLSWPTTANLDLRWRRCAPFVLVGNDDGATIADNPESTTVTIPGGDCWVLVVSQVSAKPKPEFAQLRLTSP